MQPNTKLDADQSAALLAGKIREREPFFFIRYGDGALECIYDVVGRTCDGEIYSKALGDALLDSWISLVTGSRGGVYVGDWFSASFDTKTERTRYADRYAALIGEDAPQWLHFESLLLQRESSAVVDFYRAVKEDPRDKVFMGPLECARAAKMLGARHLITPMVANLHAHFEQGRPLADFEFDVLLYGAGLAGNVAAVRCWERHPERTYVHLGSALDPLVWRRSRQQQLAPARAKELFADLLV